MVSNCKSNPLLVIGLAGKWPALFFRLGSEENCFVFFSVLPLVLVSLFPIFLEFAFVINQIKNAKNCWI